MAVHPGATGPILDLDRVVELYMNHTGLPELRPSGLFAMTSRR